MKNPLKLPIQKYAMNVFKVASHEISNPKCTIVNQGCINRWHSPLVKLLKDFWGAQPPCQCQVVEHFSEVVSILLRICKLISRFVRNARPASLECHTLLGTHSGGKSNKFSIFACKFVPFYCHKRERFEGMILPEIVPSGNHATYQQILRRFGKHSDFRCNNE